MRTGFRGCSLFARTAAAIFLPFSFFSALISNLEAAEQSEKTILHCKGFLIDRFGHFLPASKVELLLSGNSPAYSLKERKFFSNGQRTERLLQTNLSGCKQSPRYKDILACQSPNGIVFSTRRNETVYLSEGEHEGEKILDRQVDAEIEAKLSSGLQWNFRREDCLIEEF